MRSLTKTYFTYSVTIRRAATPSVHHGSARWRSVTTGKGHERDVGQLMSDLGERARHVIVRRDHDQRAETAALRPAPGLDRIAQRIEGAIEIDAAAHPALELRVEPGDFIGIGRTVAPLMSNRLPRPDASNSIASVMREAPPVSATMPSASRVSVSFVGRHAPDEPEKPELPSPAPEPHSTRTSTSRAPQQRTRSGPRGSTCVTEGTSAAPSSVWIGPSTSLVHLRNHSAKSGGAVAMHCSQVCLINRFDRALDRIARGGGSDEGDQADLRQHRQVAQYPDRRRAEQGGELVAPRRADEASRW